MTSRHPTCASSGKIRYRDRVAALLALADTRHADRSGRPKIEKRAYPCPSCHGWHLTSRR